MKISVSGDSLIFPVKVVLRASKTELAGLSDDALKIRVAAPPVEGAANEEIIKFLSRLFQVSRSSVEIIKGSQSRKKSIRLYGVSEEAFLSKIKDS